MRNGVRLRYHGTTSPESGRESRPHRTCGGPVEAQIRKGGNGVPAPPRFSPCGSCRAEARSGSPAAEQEAPGSAERTHSAGCGQPLRELWHFLVVVRLPYLPEPEKAAIVHASQKFAGARKSGSVKHSETDQVSMELARRVAVRMRRQPEVVDFARANLARWSQQNSSAPSLLRCYAEWQQILSRPVEEVCNLLCSDTDNAQRLRQNSPFAGLLSPAEVWEVKSRFRHASATA